jgi:hypothetical protein
MASNRRKRNYRQGTWQPRKSHVRLSSRFVATVLAILVIIGGAYYVLYFSPLFSLTNVSVTGTKALDAKEIQQYVRESAEATVSGVKTQSVIALDPAATARQLKNRFGDIAEVAVVKKYPKGLAVKVTEREQALLWQTKGSYYLVDRQGYAYAKAEPRTDLVSVVDSTGLPVEVGKQVVGKGFITTLEQIETGLQGIGLKVVSFRIPETTFEIQAVTDQGWYALYDTTRQVAIQTESLKQALGTGKPAQYADLRVPGRVYVR